MEKLAMCVWPGCCSGVVGVEFDRDKLDSGKPATRDQGVQVPALEDRFETLETELMDLSQRYNTAPTSPVLSPTHSLLLRSDDNYLPALMELLENSLSDSRDRQ
jgi:hypothetical protein